MPGPATRKRRIVYFYGPNVFRYVASHPWTCVQYTTFGMKEQPFNENASGDKPKKVEFTDFLGEKLAQRKENTVKIVQFFHCEGRAFGERVKNK